MPKIEPSSVVAASPDQVSCELGEEAVLLQLNNGVYYGLNPVGAAIWSLLQQPRKVSEIESSVMAEFDVDPETCRKDVVDLLEKLAAAQLIEVKDERHP